MTDTQALPAQSGPQKAETTLYSDRRWELLEGRLRIGVTNRLKRADSALYSLRVLTGMLFADSIGKGEVEAFEDTTHDGLSAAETEGIHIAVLALADIACEALDEIREDKYGCIGRKGANA